MSLRATSGSAAISIPRNISQVKEEITKVCQAINYDPQDIQVVVASKYANPDQIRDVFKAGLDTFGENRVQDLLAKQEALKDLPIKWHFIGHIQSNKVNKVAGAVELIHSVDSIKLARKINQRAKELKIEQSILIQVNVGKEASKSGFEPSKSLQNAEEIGKLEGIKLEGLMSMAPFVSEKLTLEEHFEKSKILFSQIQNKLGTSFKWLSMGMSNDFELAIKHGANMLRLGSIIFTDS